MITLKQIKNFTTLAQELHFARAAQQLGISQAALSNEIKKLENSIGCQLFDRSDRWMIKLTEAGMIYLRQMKNIPELMEESAQLARKAARGETGTLSIGVAGLIYDFIDIGQLCKNMLQKYPEVKIRIYDTLVSPAAASLVRSGKCDISFFASSNISHSLENLSFKKITNIPLAFAIPASNPVAGKENLQIQDLKNSHFILPPAEEAPRLRAHFENFFFQHCQSAPLIVHEAGGSGSLQLAAAGLGIALTPHPPAKASLKNIVLRHLPLGIDRFTVAAWDESNSSQVLRNFIALLPSSPGNSVPR